jgi:predicted acylesterase/phospholipase RssA
MQGENVTEQARANGRFCDVVMKGGVTSGIVYPPAICALAADYDLHSIGGTSVGAIAAAISAAAEYRRRQTGSNAGYSMLANLPNFLTQKGALLKLFAADRPKSTGLLRVALCFVGNTPIGLRLLLALGLAIVSYAWLLIPVGILLGIALQPAFGPLSAGAWNVFVHDVLPFALGVLAMGLLLLLGYLTHCIFVLANNDFGWCHAFDARDADEFERALKDLQDSEKDITALSARQTPRLFDWLDAFIAEAAGRKREEPLTFGDLWRANPPAWFRPADGSEDPSIDFRMVTTCLTLGRPFDIPFDDQDLLGLNWKTWEPGAKNLYFLKSDLEKYFPQGVVNHMVAHATLEQERTYPVRGRPEQLYRFPANDKLPIIVGVRMSMSFPVLFCAFRLFTPDPSDASKTRPLWFTDGGLSSNFPIHLFDSPLPSWPTFALDLLDGGSIPIPKTDVFLESEDRSITVESQYDFEKGWPLTRLLTVGSAMIDSMRTWQDTVLGALLGNSSRTVGVRLPPDEGGINLTMTKPQITDLVCRGKRAGQEIVKAFVAPRGQEASRWREQRWIRYVASMNAAIEWLRLFKLGSSSSGCDIAQSYLDLALNNYDGSPTLPKPHARPRWPDAATACAVGSVTSALCKLNVDPDAAERLASLAPRPSGELHIRPPS